MKILFKTTFSYFHRIENNEDLVDKGCAVDHFHGLVKLIVKLPVTDQFLDFKDVKKKVLDHLGKYDNQNITDKFGLGDTEQFIIQLRDELQTIFKRSVDLELWETEKYGMEIAGD